jgi:PAS domain S-box-containing protein
VADYLRALTELAQNVALLLSLTLLYSVIRPRWRHAPAFVRSVVPGMLFGMIAIIGMHAPIVVVPGVIADGRVIPVVLAGPFGGRGAALTAAVLASAYRIALGGAGAMAGAGTILTAGLIGAWLGRPGARKLGPMGFLALGLVLDASALAWSLALPGTTLARQVLGAALVPVGLFLPLGTLFLGALLTHEERRHAERERLTFTQFSVDHAAEAMFWLDAEGRFVNANPATLALTGYARDELPALRVWTVDLDTDAGAWPEVWARVRADGRVVAQHRYRRGDGATVDVEVSYDFMDYRGREWISAVARDIGERRRAEAERAEHLARERKLRVEAEAANTLKDEFLGTLSHELRTPLTAIVGYARMLRSRRLDEEAMGRALAVIERNGHAQSRLVNDLLDVSSIVLGKLRIEVRPVDLTAVARSVVDSVRPEADTKSVAVHFTADDALIVPGDGPRLQQVVGNLLANALKFTPAGGRIDVRLERAGDEVGLTVRDSGDGIQAEFLPHVFDRFRQADGSLTRAYEGLGVGLAIVRALVELHGGRVSVASEGAGRGATFVVWLPATATAPPVRPARAESPGRPA